MEPGSSGKRWPLSSVRRPPSCKRPPEPRCHGARRPRHCRGAVTLILSCVTPEYVVQVSDRRLTMLDGSVVERPENKALFYCGFATFSYTGLAKIGQLPTDEWLMAQLAAAPDFSAALPSLATAGTKALRNVNFSRATPAQRRSWRRLAFIGAGFAGLKHPERLGRSPVADQLHPFLVVISNFFDPTLGWLAESGVRFDWFLRWLPEDQERMVFAGGQRVSLRASSEAVPASLSQSVAGRTDTGSTGTGYLAGKPPSWF